MYTLQEIVTEQLPFRLGMAVEDFGGADDSPFSAQRCVQKVEMAHKELSRQLAIREAGLLDTEFDFETVQPADASAEVEVDLPPNCYQLVALNAIQDSGQVLFTVLARDPKAILDDPNRWSQAYYRNKGRKIVLIRPSANLYRMTYQRSPGRLCYGAVESAEGNSLVVEAATAGQLDGKVNGYKGDMIALISPTGAQTVYNVTAYDPEARTFTTLEDLPVVTAEWQYSILSFLRDADQDMLVALAASYFRIEAPGRAEEAQAEYARQFNDFVTAQQNLDNRTPQKVLQIEQGFTMPRPRWVGGGLFPTT